MTILLSSDGGFPYWIFALIVVIAVTIGILSWVLAKKRAQALQAVAQQIGFNYVGDDRSRTVQVQTALFNRGGSRKFRNIMNGSRGGFEISLFDYSYTVSTGKSSQTTTQTVAAFVQGVSLPTFELRPENFMDRVSEIFVHRDIDFDSHPEFSRRCLLSGREEERIRKIFTPALLSFLEALTPEKKWHIEGCDFTLIVYRSDKTVRPEDIQPFLDETLSIAQTFFASCGQHHAKQP
jgi:hypothetical protein